MVRRTAAGAASVQLLRLPPRHQQAARFNSRVSAVAVVLVYLLSIVDGAAGQSCDGSTTLTTASGGFNDGSWVSDEYMHNLVCSWIIFPPANGYYDTIELSFSRLDTEAIYDALRLLRLNDSRNGWEDTGLTVSGSLEDLAPSTIKVRTVALKVEFITDATVAGTGFDAFFRHVISTSDDNSGGPSSGAGGEAKSCFGTIRRVEEFGVLADGSAPGEEYSAGLECSWIIAPQERTEKYIEVEFIRFDVADDHGVDVVQVYELGVSGGWEGPIAEISGTYSLNVFWENKVATEQVAMKVVFLSSAEGTTGVRGTGWEASFYQTNSPRHKPDAPGKSCDGEILLDSPVGRFTDGSPASDIYSPELACSWVLAPAPTGLRLSHGMQLSFTRFHLQEGYDFVRVFEGRSTIGPWTPVGFPGVLTGEMGDGLSPSSSALNFETDLPVMRVEFTSDASQHRAGFAANYWQTDGPAIPKTVDGSPDSSTCSLDNGVIDDPIGHFSDGSGPYGNYSASSAVCNWTIRPSTPTHYGMYLRFDRFDTEQVFDTLRLYELNSEGNAWDGPIAELSGKLGASELAEASFYTERHAVRLEFISNSNIGRGGFEGLYWPADRQLTSVSAGKTCSGGELLRSANGEFGDGSAEGVSYSPGVDCSWVIWPADLGGRSLLELTFSNFDTEPNTDFVSVYELSEEGEGWVGPLAQLSGASEPGQSYRLTSSAVALKVDFTTNNDDQRGGFHVSWRPTNVPVPITDGADSKTCHGTESLTNVYGTFTDGSAADGTYSNHADCEWVIIPPPLMLTTGMELEFARFDTEQNADMVAVYERRSGSSDWFGPVLELSGSFTGGRGNYWGVKSAPDAVALRVVFTTDSFRRGTGFTARFAPQLPEGQTSNGEPPCLSISLLSGKTNVQAEVDTYIVITSIRFTDMTPTSFTNVLRSALLETLRLQMIQELSLSTRPLALISDVDVVGGSASNVSVEFGPLDSLDIAQSMQEALSNFVAESTEESSGSGLHTALLIRKFPELGNGLDAVSVPRVEVIPGVPQSPEATPAPAPTNNNSSNNGGSPTSEDDNTEDDTNNDDNTDNNSQPSPTPPNPDAPPDDENSDDDSPTNSNDALVIGVVAGTLSILFIAVLIGIFFVIRKRFSALRAKIAGRGAPYGAKVHPEAGQVGAAADVLVSSGQSPVKTRAGDGQP